MIRKDPQDGFFLGIKLGKIWISMRVNFAHHLSACTDTNQKLSKLPLESSCVTCTLWSWIFAPKLEHCVSQVLTGKPLKHANLLPVHLLPFPQDFHHHRLTTPIRSNQNRAPHLTPGPQRSHCPRIHNRRPNPSWHQLDSNPFLFKFMHVRWVLMGYLCQSSCSCPICSFILYFRAHCERVFVVIDVWTMPI